MQLESKFNFKDEVRDVITGMQGIVVAIDFWMNGCIRIGVQGKMKKNSDNYPDVFWIDSHQLEIVKKKAIELKESKPTEGPMPCSVKNMSVK